MRILLRILIALLAFALGFALVACLAIYYMRLTYHCVSGPLEPCDAGPMLALSITMLFGPIAGLLMGILAWVKSKKPFQQCGR